MKQFFLIMFICISVGSYSQIVQKDIFYSLQFSASFSPRFDGFDLSRTARYLPDSLSGRIYLSRLRSSSQIVDVMEMMSDEQWQLVNSTSFPSTQNHNGYVVFVYKKQVSYTEEMLRQGREALQEDTK